MTDAPTARAPFWPRRSPAFLRARLAVRGIVAFSLDDAHPHPLRPSPGVVVGLSGGADSLALTAACVAEAMGWGPGAPASASGGEAAGHAAVHAAVHAVVVDHGLQDASAEVAEKAAATARGLGATAEVIRVDVPGGESGSGSGSESGSGVGPEAAARAVRHAALHRVAAELGRPLLLAHTLDDQAETVLLGLARGSGPAALSGMDPDRTWDDGVRVVRPFLGGATGPHRGRARHEPLRRADTVAACAELGLDPWHDPHNDDPAYARVRVRATALPMLEELLGPGVAANLARTADLIRDDAAALDAAARAALDPAGNDAGNDDPAAGEGPRLRIGDVVKQPPAVATRMLKLWAEANGAAALSAAHVRALDKLARATGADPSAAVALPAAAPRGPTPGEPGGRLVVHRKGGTLAVSRGNSDPS